MSSKTTSPEPVAVVPAAKHPVGSATTRLEEAIRRAQQGKKEELKHEDYTLPFLKMVQALSPEKQRGDAKYVNGAEDGDFVNSLTGELWKSEQGVEVVRVWSKRQWIEWRPRKAGGGIRRLEDGNLCVYDTKEAAEANRQPLSNPSKGWDKDNDTALVETAQIFAMVRGKDGWTPVVIAWKNTQLKAWRDWNGLMGQQTARRWLGETAPDDLILQSYEVVYRITSRAKQNPQQQTYFVPVVHVPRELTEDGVARMAERFQQQITQGRVKVSTEGLDPDDAGGAATPASNDY